jgi:hypothetical protein
MAVEFEDFQVKSDRGAVLRSLAKLSAEASEGDMAPALAGQKE